MNRLGRMIFAQLQIADLVVGEERPSWDGSVLFPLSERWWDG
jgi:hypothetical protein